MWNTGIVTVYNNCDVPLAYVDEEHDGHRGSIASGHNTRFGFPAPWCINSFEVGKKAIRFAPEGFAIARDSRPAEAQIDNPEDAEFIPGFYLFQNYNNNQIYWVPATSATSWQAIQWCGEGPSSWVNIRIGNGPNGTYMVQAQAVG